MKRKPNHVWNVKLMVDEEGELVFFLAEDEGKATLFNQYRKGLTEQEK